MDVNRDKSGAGNLPFRIFGKTVDGQTRCEHHRSDQDIIAIKFKCCGQYYPCYKCHEETAGHVAQVWGKDEHDTKAVLCGVCANEMTITEYLDAKFKCPSCKAAFNPGCANHYHLYFEL